MKKTGIQLTVDGDLAVNNYLQVGDTLYQNQYLILQAQKGEFKEYPMLGVGVDDMINDEDSALVWENRIKDSFQRDGLLIKSITMANGQISINADYE